MVCEVLRSADTSVRISKTMVSLDRVLSFVGPRLPRLVGCLLLGFLVCVCPVVNRDLASDPAKATSEQRASDKSQQKEATSEQDTDDVIGCYRMRHPPSRTPETLFRRVVGLRNPPQHCHQASPPDLPPGISRPPIALRC
jgi:hypothetical protein